MRRLAPLVFALVGCGAAGPSVTRVVDGRPVTGRFVQPVAYELFLRGAIADETGQTDAAIQAFEQAARVDADDPLVWTKLGQARCKKDPRDGRAREALDKALSIDPDFGPALASLVTCGAAGGDVAKRAIAAEPADVPLAVSMQRALASASDDADARVRFMALALTHPTVGAWAALYEWGEAHTDDLLSSWAASRLAASTAWTGKLEDHCKALAGDGALLSARSLAGALVDADAHVTDALVARLAIDDALSRSDRPLATRRASKCHVSLSEVAGRALVMGDVSTASQLAGLVAGADPKDVPARMVLAAVGEDGQDLHVVENALGDAPSGDADPAARLVFARALARVGEPEQARAFAAAPGLMGTDALLVPLAVELVATGGVDIPSLPAEARIELAVRNDDRATLQTLAASDRRHRLVVLAWSSPRTPDVKGLALALGRRSPDDSLVRAAILHLVSANEPAASPPTIADALELLRLGPVDPIAVASSLRVLGSTPTAAKDFDRAKARMAAVAVTPHEHRLAE